MTWIINRQLSRKFVLSAKREDIHTFGVCKLSHRFMSKFIQFIAGEALNLSVGYLAGLTASTLVSKFFVKKGLVNLWGLTAKREAVSKDDYEWLMFIASYLIGLFVMASVTYGMKKIRKPASPPPDIPAGLS